VHTPLPASTSDETEVKSSPLNPYIPILGDHHHLRNGNSRFGGKLVQKGLGVLQSEVVVELIAAGLTKSRGFDVAVCDPLWDGQAIDIVANQREEHLAFVHGVSGVLNLLANAEPIHGEKDA